MGTASRAFCAKHGKHKSRKCANTGNATHDMPMPPVVSKLHPVYSGRLRTPGDDDRIDWLIAEPRYHPSDYKQRRDC